jgi:ribosomal protein L20A (L18A)
MQEIEKEHVELAAFFELLRNTPIENIHCERGNRTYKIVSVKTPVALLEITYLNITTDYKIKYKSVTIKEGFLKIEQENYIHNQVSDIIEELNKEVKKEFLKEFLSKYEAK